MDFEQKLYYNTGDGTPRYNGKISSIKWLTPSIDNTDTITNGYSFVYDQQDRLVSAYSSSGKYGQERYTEEFTYDKQGNIAMLYRYGGENGHLIDETLWNYNGNQVTRITDISGDQSAYNIKEYHDYNHSGDDFYYDSNGNMTADLDRDIVTIRYNAIDLPDTVQFKNGSTIIYHYLADGRKIKAQYTTSYSAIIVPRGETLASMGLTIRAMSSMSAWNGPLEYIGSPFACDSLIRIHNRYGYYDCREKEFRYYATDYQGNVRTVYSNIKINIIKPVKTLSSSANIVLPPIRFVKVHQRMQYYPDGLPYDECYRADEQPYKYGELEFIEMHGFDSYDNGRRHYSPAMHRFTSFDPLAEHFYHESPYAHCGNDPVNYIDPSGMIKLNHNDDDSDENIENEDDDSSDPILGKELPEVVVTAKTHQYNGQSSGSSYSYSWMLLASQSVGTFAYLYPQMMAAITQVISHASPLIFLLLLQGDTSQHQYDSYNTDNSNINDDSKDNKRHKKGGKGKKKNYKKLSDSFVQELKKRGLDVHQDKAKQGNLGDVNYYKDQKGNLYYSHDGIHVEPLLQNIDDFY